MGLCGLCLGPFGIFFVVFLCAAAGGILGSMTGEMVGGSLYGKGEEAYGRIFHSPEEFVGAF